MALIGTIRKNFWFVLILLGLALIAFIFMDMTGSRNMAQGSNLTLAKIDGNSIDYRDFQTTESVLYGNSPGDPFQKRDAIWDYYVEKSIIDTEAGNLGLAIGRDELMDLQYGANMSPIVRQNFTNPQTGQLDQATLLGYKQAFENDEVTDPNFRRFWNEQEKQIRKTQLQDKLNTIVSKSIYTPSWMAEEVHKQQESKVDFSYVKIPYTAVPDNAVSISDSDYTNYIAANAATYTNDEETRSLQYVEVDVNATPADSATWRNQMTDLANQFRTVTNDSTFAVNNKGFYANFYFKTEDLPEVTQNYVGRMNVGDVAGPYVESGGYRVVKLIDKRIVADSVKARHILRTFNDDITKKAAKNYVDSLLTVLRRNGESFDSLAIKNSQDPGSAIKGGDLGYFVQGRMQPSFNEACFFTGKVGDYSIVETPFGYHLLQVNDRKYLDQSPKYKVAHINTPIIPSTTTQEALSEKIADLIASYPYLSDLVTAVQSSGEYNVKTINNIKANDHILGDLGGGNTSRDIVKFLYDGNSSLNDVSPNVHAYSDQVNFFDNKYVVGGLSAITTAGLQSADQAKAGIAALVMNQKKGEYLQGQVTSNDLNSIASQYGASVETANSVAASSTIVPGLGNEPDVIAAAMAMGAGEVSKPIAGNAGSYVIKVNNRTEAGAASNIPNLRKLQSTALRNQTQTLLMESLKKGAKIDDMRSTYF